MIAMQCMTANVTQIMTWNSLGTIQLKNAFRLAFDCKQVLSRMRVAIDKAQEAQFWRKLSHIVRNIVRWNRGSNNDSNWNGLCLQTNLISTVLNTIFENSYVVLSWYAGKLNENHPWCQMILNGCSCISAILLHVQRHTLEKGNHSGSWARTNPI